MFLPNWSYDGPDPGLRLFTLANQQLPAVHSHPFVYEIGACDTDWLERAASCLPQATMRGLDWRDTPRKCVEQGNILDAAIMVADAYVSISAIEHVGLGHYQRDPVDPYGDIKAMQRVRDAMGCWSLIDTAVRPAPFFYFDVPYAPEGYFVKGTKCRVYDDQALQERFGPHKVLGYTLPSVNGWIEKPTRNCDGPKPYYYVALLVRKAGAEN